MSDTVTTTASNMSEDMFSVKSVLGEYLDNFHDSRNRKYAYTVFKIFKNLNEFGDERMKFALQCLKEAGYIKPNLMVRDVKSSQRAVKKRSKGNLAFTERKYSLAIQYYSESLCHAPIDSKEMALAYADRTKVLFKTRLYAQCAQDASYALQLSKHLKGKMLIDINKLKDASSKAVNTIQQPPYYEDVELGGMNKIDEHNRDIKCAASCVNIYESPDLDRGIYATCDIPAGTVVSIENPYCMYTVEPLHCHNCLKVCYNPIPCLNCTYLMFCNENCRKIACRTFHLQEVECRLMHTFRTVLKCNRTQMTALRFFFTSYIDAYPMLHYEYMGNSFDGWYHSGRYEEMHYLATNAMKRPVMEQFEICLEAAYLMNIIEEHCLGMHVYRTCLPLHLQIVAINFSKITELVVDKPVTAYQGGIADNLSNIKHIADAGYSFGSLFNHACVPNIARFYFNTTMVVRTIAPIKPGEQLYDCYGYHFATTEREMRRTALADQFHFECECRACLWNWPIYENLPWNNTSNHGQITKFNNILCHRPSIETVLDLLHPLLESIKLFIKVDGGKNCEFYTSQELLKKCFTLISNKRISIEPKTIYYSIK